MERKIKTDIPSLLQKAVLFLFGLFPVIFSILAQVSNITASLDSTQTIIFSGAVIVFIIPLLVIIAKNTLWQLLDKSSPLPILWTLALALILRILILQLLGTNFISDFEDVHLLAIDIHAGTPLANLNEYPSIPYALHYDMPALVLSVVYKLFGVSTSNAKLFMVALGVATTYLLYLTGKEIVNKKVGLITAFLFASLPSTICYSGTLAGDYLAFPPMLLALFLYARTQKKNAPTLLYLLTHYAIIGILIGMIDWFRPVGAIMLVSIIISVLLQAMQKKKIIKTVALLALLIFAYKGTVNLAIYTSENIFQTDILGSFDRVGEFLVKGLNPSAQGRVTIEDNVLVHEIYARYGNDILGAQRYLVQFSFSRLEQGDLLKMFKEKFTLVWASHDALFDYSLTGSNDHKFVNLLRGFEYILWLVITVLILINATFSFKKEVITSTFAIQLFMLGFALLFLFMEVQNRYVAIVIPCSLLLATVGMHQLFSQKIK